MRAVLLLLCVGLVSATPRLGHRHSTCNVTGDWYWLPIPAWKPLHFVATANGGFHFSRTAGQPDAPWSSASGQLYFNRTVHIDYGCGTGPPCQVSGSVDVGCSVITVINGVFSRSCPPPPPPAPVLPMPRSFAGDVEWLAQSAIYVLGNSKQKTPSGDALYTPNMQPGGYGGEFARDYTYGVVHTPWANPARAAAAARWNLTLDGFVWATEHLLAGQQAGTGLMPDAVSATGAAFNKCFQQYCTFPPSSPLPRPSCCAHGNCTIGSMDNAAFATFNALFLVRATADRRGAPAGAALLARWLPALERGLAQIPTGPAGSVAASLAFNDPASPVVGYGFEDTVAKTGALHFASLLLLEASATLCQAIRRYSTHHAGLFRRSGAADALCDQARNISAALGPALWDERIGMFKPATGLEGNLTDIWGSAYAASLDGVHTMMGGADAWPVDVPPPVTAAQRSRIVSFLAQAPNGIFAAGQARHLPVGQGWTQSWCVPAGAGPGGPPCRVGFNYNPGGYQDGGFWATPVHHIWPLLHRTPATRALACSLLRDFVTSVHAGGPGTDVMRAINEWVDAHGKPHGAAGYVASASNPAAAATTMAAGGGCSY